MEKFVNEVNKVDKFGIHYINDIKLLEQKYNTGLSKYNFIMSNLLAQRPEVAKYVHYGSLEKLALRNKSISAWLADQKTQWRTLSQAPDYLKGVLSPQEYALVLAAKARRKDRNASFAASVMSAMEVYNKSVSTARETFDKESEVDLKVEVVFIESMNFEYLPISLQSQLALADWTGDEKEKEVIVLKAEEALRELKLEAIKALRAGTFSFKDYSKKLGL